MNLSQKIVSREFLKKKIRLLRQQKKTIAFTNGCFDILHAGHVSYLQKAKGKNRILIVGLNSNSSVKKIKGPNRPIVAEQERAFVLAGLSCVDFVTIFQEETPYDLIKYIQPDILIKGADWKEKQAVGADLVKARGGKVEYITYLPHCSSTRIIETILKKCVK
ncbi:MAG TPA: D-glycero-beta-D-manno-heptose 1-phosphate adenylyltransferase [Candidatus Omnitrophota bacterium]|nr:D-glycero-beta-D-manno-heptose 1-phosphate adenylyltransferase [Candidatus Omnitrophota bacterium]HPN88151.1 D-glycero-beta-D-manno-heptose 1-phosphate adenylyltransferase [Candidatus Omnitrophota bacterium]